MAFGHSSAVDEARLVSSLPGSGPWAAHATKNDLASACPESEVSLACPFPFCLYWMGNSGTHGADSSLYS